MRNPLALTREVISRNIALLTTTFIVLVIAFFILLSSQTPQTIRAVAGDGASSNIQLLDTNANGKIDRITFDIANPNNETWSLSGASPNGISVTFDGDDITISSVTITSGATANPITIQVDLDETDVQLLVDTEGISTNAVELVYTQGNAGTNCTTEACITDDTDEELNAIATGDGAGAVNTEADAAAPQIISFTYQDNSGNGGIDQFLATFSEPVTAASVLDANSLTLTNVGDFTGAVFGVDATDVVTGSVTSATVVLGTEATAVDTFEGSSNIAISSQNSFSLTDGTNVNNTLGAQTQATFLDGAAPVIQSFTYQDNDNDLMIDQFLVTFSEIVTAASILAPDELSLTNVGDFTGAAFGGNVVDVINGSVSSATVVLGTEATVEDTTEDSGNIVISTVDDFELTDGTNLNSVTGPQPQAVFIDGATKGSSPCLVIPKPFGCPGYVPPPDPVEPDPTDITDIVDPVPDQEPVPDQDTVVDDPDAIQDEPTPTPDEPVIPAPFPAGSRIRAEGSDAVHYLDNNGILHVFLNQFIYEGWFGNDFSGVLVVTAEELASLQLGIPVPHRPGTVIKVQSSPEVYLITEGLIIRHIANEEVALALLGSDWNKQILDVDPATFILFTIGDPITLAGQVDLEALLSSTVNLDVQF